MEFYRNLCPFWSKFVWGKICVEKKWQIWGLDDCSRQVNQLLLLVSTIKILFKYLKYSKQSRIFKYASFHINSTTETFAFPVIRFGWSFERSIVFPISNFYSNNCKSKWRPWTFHYCFDCKTSMNSKAAFARDK